MKKSDDEFFIEKEKYLSPIIEVTEIEVERGFTASVKVEQGSGTAASWSDGVEDLEWD